MRLIDFLIVLIFLQCLFASEVPLSSEGSGSAADEKPVEDGKQLMSIEELNKLPGKQLRAMLDKKGVVCKGCSEKIDFVNRVFETQELPDKEVIPPPVEEGKGLSQEKINELMDDLKRRGFTKDGKVVSGSDFSNMSPEEMIAAMNRKPPPVKKNSKKSKEKAKIIDEFEASDPTTTSSEKKAKDSENKKSKDSDKKKNSDSDKKKAKDSETKKPNDSDKKKAKKESTPKKEAKPKKSEEEKSETIEL